MMKKRIVSMALAGAFAVTALAVETQDPLQQEHPQQRAHPQQRQQEKAQHLQQQTVQPLIQPHRMHRPVSQRWNSGMPEERQQ